jgi:protein angel
MSVVSYNILAQCLLEEHSELYGHCNEQHRGWRYRRRNLFRQLDQHKPDVICLQEVQHEHYNSCILPHLRQNGYEGHYLRRTGDKHDGCATFYKQHKFCCVNAVPVEFFVEGSSVLNRNDVALLLVLRPLRGSSHVVIANTHLLFNPKRGEVKLAQLMYLFAAIDEVAAQTFDPLPIHDPVILCGDLNLAPYSPLYEFITNGRLDYKGLYSGQMSGQIKYGGHPLADFFLEPRVDITDHCQFHCLVQYRQQRARVGGRQRAYQESPKFGSGMVSHSFHFVPAYKPAQNFVTTWFSPHVVDYIFYSVGSGTLSESRYQQKSDVVKGSLKFQNVLPLPTASQVKQAGGLPNDTEPSDHLLLMAYFILYE